MKRTLFFVNKNFEANITLEKLINSIFSKKSNILIKKIKKVHDEFKNNINFFNICIKNYADNLRIKKLIFQKKNKVYLL